MSVSLPTFRPLRAALRQARRGKKPSADVARFDARWLDGLLQLERELAACSWHPSAPTLRIASAPKAREIHAPAFADRVVHHWLVPPLERLYEPSFIHDSYSNRDGKGTHRGVARLHRFVRQVHSGQGGGFYLQLDVRNFFNSIRRPVLYRALRDRMLRANLPLPLRRAAHALLNSPLSKTGVHIACSPTERAQVPEYKRLENAPAGSGLAIGNLFSQFGANVHLDRLDQYVKHVLKVRRYLRYVDDFVLVHHSREQLKTWHHQIVAFLQSQLQLELKPEQKLRPLTDGIDFLGYVIYPTHVRVRRRVVAHCRAKLTDWALRHLSPGKPAPERKAIEKLRAVWASYEGHFRHADSYRLVRQLHQQFPWLSGMVA